MALLREVFEAIPYEVPLLCRIQHWFTWGTQEVKLIKVKADDHSWVTADDRSELSNDWNPIAYQDGDGSWVDLVTASSPEEIAAHEKELAEYRSSREKRNNTTIN